MKTSIKQQILASVDDEVIQAVRDSVIDSNGAGIETLDYIIEFCEEFKSEIIDEMEEK